MHCYLYDASNCYKNIVLDFADLLMQEVLTQTMKNEQFPQSAHTKPPATNNEEKKITYPVLYI